ncbi:hypothetical protein M0805_003352 [Coniferiporia weirii]|nr:hypothetical protein M0805_003352 [Coniferiporia weirii]
MAEQLDDETIVLTLNSLLTSLEIPLILESPLDLTPSLILAIFESMLKTRLPISPETRRSATHPARVAAMKIFIGVLEDDVLGVEIGLGEIDPRRLAEGRRDEVVLVAQVLCWLAKRMNYVSQDGLSVGNIAPSANTTMREPGFGGDAPPSPSMHSTASTSRGSSLLMHTTRSLGESQTTASNRDASEAGSSFLNAPPSYHHTTSFSDSYDTLPGFSRHRELEDFPLPRRRRRHEAHSLEQEEEEEGEDREVADEGGEETGTHEDGSFCHCATEVSSYPMVTPRIRTTGYLERMNLDEEIKSFESSRDESVIRDIHSRFHTHTHSASRPKPRLSGTSIHTPPPRSPRTHNSPGIITRHTSPSQHTLALLNERARLLAELARYANTRG